MNSLINSWELTSGEIYFIGAMIAILIIASIAGQDPTDSVYEQMFRWLTFVLGILLAIAAVLVIK